MYLLVFSEVYDKNRLSLSWPFVDWKLVVMFKSSESSETNFEPKYVKWNINRIISLKKGRTLKWSLITKLVNLFWKIFYIIFTFLTIYTSTIYISKCNHCLSLSSRWNFQLTLLLKALPIWSINLGHVILNRAT